MVIEISDKIVYALLVFAVFCAYLRANGWPDEIRVMGISFKRKPQMPEIKEAKSFDILVPHAEQPKITDSSAGI